MALRGASDLNFFGEEDGVVEGGVVVTTPIMAKKRGSQSLLPAATVMRPATKELPSREPATTRQTRIAAKMPNAGPRRRLMAVCYILLVGSNAKRGMMRTTATLSVVEIEAQGRRT